MNGVILFDSRVHALRAEHKARKKRVLPREKTQENLAPAAGPHATYCDYLCGRFSPDFLSQQNFESALRPQYFDPQGPQKQPSYWGKNDETSPSEKNKKKLFY